jgi:hypothetical protein
MYVTIRVFPVVHTEHTLYHSDTPAVPIGGWGGTRSCYGALVDLELVILLPQPLEYWDYKGVPPCLANVCEYYT